MKKERWRMETKRVLVPMADGFEEIEAITVIDVLRRAGAEVIVAGLSQGPVKGSRGVVVVPDTALDACADGHYDMVVLPGGASGAKNLAADERIVTILRRALQDRRWVGAICAAPAVVLAGRELIKGAKATCHPSFRDRLPGFTDQRVVADGFIVTSQGPGTAMEFALALTERLFGPKKAQEIAGPMVVRQG